MILLALKVSSEAFYPQGAIWFEYCCILRKSKGDYFFKSLGFLGIQQVISDTKGSLLKLPKLSTVVDIWYLSMVNATPLLFSVQYS